MVLIRVLIAGFLAAVASMATAGAAAGFPGQQDTDPPQVLDVRFSAAAVAVSGINTVGVKVQLDLKDKGKGIETHGGEAACEFSPNVYVGRVSGQPTGGPPRFVRPLQLVRVSGTDHQGTWEATWPVPSTYNGTWQVTSICVMDNATNTTKFDPRTRGMTRSLSVTGSHQPLLRMSFSPDPLHRGQSLTIRGTVTDTATGAGMPNVPVVLGGSDEECGPTSIGAFTVRTGSTGAWSYVDQTPDPSRYYYWCSMLNLPTGKPINPYPLTAADVDNTQTAAFLMAHPRVQLEVLSAKPATNHKPHGTNVNVTGSVWPPRAYGRVFLQRLVSGNWQRVNDGNVYEDGSYTVVATPPTAGTHYYRVARPSDLCDANGHCAYLGDVSATFTITAT